MLPMGFGSFPNQGGMMNSGFAGSPGPGGMMNSANAGFEGQGFPSKPWSGANERENGENDVTKKIVFIPQARARLNIMGVFIGIAVPCLLFCGLYGIMIFRFHYLHPTLTWCVVAAAFGFSFFLYMISAWRFQFEQGPSWHKYASITCFLAAVLATFFGNFFFWRYTQPYYDYGTLNTYTSIMPGKYSGSQTADAGKIYFADGVKLNLGKSMGFKHGDTYCVVPIDAEPLAGRPRLKLPSYDFWAVGVNCCSNPETQFNCGEFRNFRARSAMRNMDEENNSFYRLAVQQAEAAYGITANHPIFLHWMQDPVAEIQKMMHNGVKYYMMGCLSFLLFNIFCVVAATFSFGKMHSKFFLV